MTGSAAARGSLRELIRLHMRWVSIVVAGLVIGQWLVLHTGAVPIVSSDGTLYVSDAHAIPSLGGLVDPKVPPGYPILLSAIFLLAGHDNLGAVLWFQVAALVAMVFELYALVLTVGLPRPAASVVATAVGSSPWLIQWERYILTEAISAWAVITLWLVFSRYLRRPSTRLAVWCGAVAAILPLVRPALALVPLALGAVLVLRLILRRGSGAGVGVTARAILIFGLISYLPVGTYVGTNAAVNSCYCYTSISNLNLFGKLYEYGMQDLAPAPDFSVLSAQIQASGGLNAFLADHPEYAADNYAQLGAFARSQFLRYPRTAVSRTVSEIKRILSFDVNQSVLVEFPFACAGLANVPFPLVTEDELTPADVSNCSTSYVGVGAVGDNINRVVYFFMLLAYVMLPAAAVLGAALVLVQRDREQSWMLLAAAGGVGAVVLSIAVGGYESFDRLKVPSDAIALVAFALMLGELVFLGRQVGRLMVRSRADAEEELART